VISTRFFAADNGPHATDFAEVYLNPDHTGVVTIRVSGPDHDGIQGESTVHLSMTDIRALISCLIDLSEDALNEEQRLPGTCGDCKKPSSHDLCADCVMQREG
jgi:hypothetical protein